MLTPVLPAANFSACLQACQPPSSLLFTQFCLLLSLLPDTVVACFLVLSAVI
jgi:hypothetical protein